MSGLKWKLQLEDWSANNNAVQLSGSIDVSEGKRNKVQRTLARQTRATK